MPSAGRRNLLIIDTAKLNPKQVTNLKLVINGIYYYETGYFKDGEDASKVVILYTGEGHTRDGLDDIKDALEGVDIATEPEFYERPEDVPSLLRIVAKPGVKANKR